MALSYPKRDRNAKNANDVRGPCLGSIIGAWIQGLLGCSHHLESSWVAVHTCTSEVAHPILIQ